MALVMLSAGVAAKQRPTSLVARDGAAAIFSEAWAAQWRRAIADGHPWGQLLMDNAQASGGAAQRYDDRGAWGTMAYGISGDSHFADQAWKVIESNLDVPGPNEVREYLTERALLYWGLKRFWAQPANAGKRKRLIAATNAWADAALARMRNRRSDSDETVGALGVLLWGLVSAEHNPQARRLLNDPMVGGLKAQPASDKTVRSAVALFVQRAAGGVWIESSSYNLNTLRLLIMGTEGIRAVTGLDHFPEVTAFYREAAVAEIHKVTSDLKQAFQWGDEEHPRLFAERLTQRVTTLGMLAGVTQGTQQGAYLQGFVKALADKYGYRGYRAAEPWSRMFYTYNPYAPVADWRAMPPVYDAPGMGFVFVRDSWEPPSAFLGLHTSNPPNVDHQTPSATEFQIYRRGEWVVRDPLLYGGNAYADNTALVGGLGAMHEFTGRLATEVDAQGRYVYALGATAGNATWSGYWDPPPSFVHEASRAMFYAPSVDHRSVALVLYDRISAEPPTRLDRFYTQQRAAIESAPLKQVLFHSEVRPEISGGGVSWTSPRGQAVRIRTLTDGWAPRVVEVTPQLVGGTAFDSELGYAVSLTPALRRKWDTLLSVVLVSDPGASVEASTIDVTQGTAEGVILRREGQPDMAVVFSARPPADLPPARVQAQRLVARADIAERLRTARTLTEGLSFQIESATDVTSVFVLDLPALSTWQHTSDAHADAVDGRTHVQTSAAGIAAWTVQGPGKHQLSIRPQ